MRLFGEAPHSTTIVLFGEDREVERGRLGKHLKLGQLLDQYGEVVGTGHPIYTYLVLTTYLELAADLERKEVGELSFIEFGLAILELQNLNRLRLYPPFMEGAAKSEPLPWDYPERKVAYWVHLLASEYGWSRQEILDLEPEEAVVYVQEIMVDHQLAKEWEWGLSDVSRSWNPVTKKMKFSPLKRPKWMLRRIEETPKITIPQSLLPVGRVIDMGGAGAPGATEAIIYEAEPGPEQSNHQIGG